MDKHICKACTKKVQSFCIHITCDVCKHAYHAKCVNLTGEEVEAAGLWYCPPCIQSIFVFNHLDEDNEFHSAVMENLLDCSYPYHEMSNKIFIPFEINDSIDTPLTEVDPDIQFYSSVEYIQSTKCDYYLEDKFISIIAEKKWKRKKFVIFSYQHQKLTQTL